MAAYKSAAALEMAIKAAAKASPQDTGRAIAGFYHHRLLCRIFSEPDSPFVLKGGLGLLARTTDARYTRDIDLATSKLGPDEAIEELNALAQKDMDDFVSFVPRGWRPIKAEDEYRDGYSVSYDAYLGLKKVLTVSVDLVSDQLECVSTELVMPADRIDVAGFERIPYPLYPSERAVADKVCGIIERHGDRASSRIKDLVDIVVYALTESFDNQELSSAIRRELRARSLPTPDPFTLPEEWSTSMGARYTKTAESTGLPNSLKTLNAAERVSSDLLTLPLTKPDEECTWDNQTLSWVPRTEPK